MTDIAIVPPVTDGATAPAAPPGDAPAIELVNVHRRFGDKEVLRGLDLAVRPGEIHALLGRNGCGKTTALRILLGFLPPHHGRASILGKDSARLGPEDRGRIGYVSEDHRLPLGARVGELIAFEAATRPRFRADEARAAAKRCGLPERQRIFRLSRGQRAQVALILAVASDPAVLVCDDPALGLDAVMRRELLDVMIELLAEKGFAVLFSSHFLTDVERIADRVSVLAEGRLIASAPLYELKQRLQKRLFVPRADAQGPPKLPSVLRARKQRGGFELLLLDADAAAEAQLAAQGRLSPEVLRPTLEELFIDLTRRDADRVLGDIGHEEKTS
jgi:ABC-2 type transport system ATP-binding protein